MIISNNNFKAQQDIRFHKLFALLYQTYLKKVMN